MAGHARDESGELRFVLDEMYPLSAYSPEDRLRALLFGLRAGSATGRARLREAAGEVGVPPPVVEALLDSDAQALHAALTAAGQGWPMLASLLAYTLDADIEVLRAVQIEYEEIALGFSQRHLLPLAPEVLRLRGYRLADAAAADPSHHTDPRRVSTREELLRALRCLRASEGDPPWRTMEQRCAVIPPGADRDKHQPRSYNTLRLLVHRTAPCRTTLPAVLAFVRGCGVTDLGLLRAWEDAYRRVAVADEAADTGSRPRFRLRPRDTPTGPQSSHS